MLSWLATSSGRVLGLQFTDGGKTLTGAVVAEWFVGNRGLGMVIFRANQNLDTPTLFAAVAVLSLAGIVIYGLIAALERRVLFWHESVRSSE